MKSLNKQKPTDVHAFLRRHERMVWRSVSLADAAARAIREATPECRKPNLWTRLRKWISGISKKRGAL